MMKNVELSNFRRARRGEGRNSQSGFERDPWAVVDGQNINFWNIFLAFQSEPMKARFNIQIESKLLSVNFNLSILQPKDFWWIFETILLNWSDEGEELSLNEDAALISSEFRTQMQFNLSFFLHLRARFFSSSAVNGSPTLEQVKSKKKKRQEQSSVASKTLHFSSAAIACLKD